MQETPETISAPTPSYENEVYPSLVKRVQSSFIDALVTFILAGLLVTVVNKINDDNVLLKIIALIVAISYEPVMTVFSRTLGQRITGLRVRKADEDKRTDIFSGYVRYVIKTMLGWLSFVTIHSNPRRRAIHDMVANTVVVSNGK